MADVIITEDRIDLLRAGIDGLAVLDSYVGQGVLYLPLMNSFVIFIT